MDAPIYESLQFSLYKNNDENSKKDSKKDKNKKDDRIRLQYKFDEHVLEKVKESGSCISTGVSNSICFMKFLYVLLIIIGTYLVVFLSIHIYQDYLALMQGEFITIVLSSLCFVSGTMGLAKLKKRSIANFCKINFLLFLSFICALFFLSMRFCNYLCGSRMEKYIENNFVCVAIVSGVTSFISLLLICMNKALVSFYKNYNEKLKQEKLLGDELVEINNV